jgi:predicted dehydrogenase
VKEIVDSGELGTITKIEASLAFPANPFLSDDDIRLKYDLGGGAMMDLGCELLTVQSPFSRYYSLQVTRYLYRGT